MIQIAKWRDDSRGCRPKPTAEPLASLNTEGIYFAARGRDFLSLGPRNDFGRAEVFIFVPQKCRICVVETSQNPFTVPQSTALEFCLPRLASAPLLNRSSGPVLHPGGLWCKVVSVAMCLKGHLQQIAHSGLLLCDLHIQP